VIEMAGTGAFDGGSRESSGPCLLGWDGAELVTSAKTGIGTSAPELAVVLARAKTPRPTFSAAYKREWKKYE
jgi:hypothetical protein